MRCLVSLVLVLTFVHACAVEVEPAGSDGFDLRPRVQILDRAGPGLAVTAETRILLPEGWPAHVTIAAEELARTLKAASGIEPAVVRQQRLEPKRGDIVVGPYWTIMPRYVEPLSPGLIRPAPAEGYNIRIDEKHCMLHGNTPRGCFQGLQTLTQVVRQTPKAADGGYVLPGLLISDWPDHEWRTLQCPFVVLGSAYDRGQHLYRPVTRTDLLRRTVRLGAHHKLSGLVVEVGNGMTYERHPEVFVEGFAANAQAGVRAAVDEAKALGFELVPFLNASGSHDLWLVPYAYAVPGSDLYIEALHDVCDEVIETFRPRQLHIGMDEDDRADFDGVLLREVAVHKQVILATYEFLRRRGVRTSMWYDGIHILRDEARDLPRDIISLPWMYGGWAFMAAGDYIDQGFRILCSPWSAWHHENDQFFSIYAASLRSEKMLGMAGTFWHSITPGVEWYYQWCLIKAADAFWSPLQAHPYPAENKETVAFYRMPEFAAIASYLPPHEAPQPLKDAERAALIERVCGDAGDPIVTEAARERLVAAGTAVVPELLKALAELEGPISPWAEGTIRRIVREPRGPVEAMGPALKQAAGSSGELRALALEMLGRLGDVETLDAEDAADPAVAHAMGVSGDGRFGPKLLAAAKAEGAWQTAALAALGRLKDENALLELRVPARKFNDEAREAYARAIGMQGSERMIGALAELSRDENARVRLRAAIGLGATRSAKARGAIIGLLEDDDPAVFKVGLYWCTDTHIVPFEDYFPRLTARLGLEEDPAIVKPILHALLMMWDPPRGQWLSKNEDPAKRVEYAELSVWKDRALIKALGGMLEYERDRRLAIDAALVLARMGSPPAPAAVVELADKLSLEDVRHFVVRVRNDKFAPAVASLRRLWKTDDQFVRNLILQCYGVIVTPEAFEGLWEAYPTIPEGNRMFHMIAAGSMAKHVRTLDATARRAVPVLLEMYAQAGPDGRRAFDVALCRASGRPVQERLSDEPEDVAARLAGWKKWWRAKQ